MYNLRFGNFKVKENQASLGKEFMMLNQYNEVLETSLLMPVNQEIKINDTFAKYKAIYIPNFNGKILENTSDFRFLDTKKLIVDTKIKLTKELTLEERYIPLVDYAFPNLFRDIASERDFFEEIIVYINSDFRWDDILYDFRGKTNSIKLIIRDTALLKANGRTSYDKLDGLFISNIIRDKFQKFNCIVNMSNQKTLNLGGQFKVPMIEFSEDNKSSINYEDSEVQNEEVERFWNKMLKLHRNKHSNMFYIKEDINEIPFSFNIVDQYNVNQGNIAYIKEEDGFRFNPVADIFLDTINRYKDIKIKEDTDESINTSRQPKTTERLSRRRNRDRSYRITKQSSEDSKQ